MAITSYSTLKAEIAAWVDRDDLTDNLDSFIDLVEADLNRRLRIRAMETSFSGNLSSGVFAVPSGYRQLRSMYLDASPSKRVEPAPLDWLYMTYPNRASSGLPEFVAREGSNFVFGPYPDSDYAVSGIYWKAFDALSASNETNWLTENAPDVLLYGGLTMAEAFGWNDERLLMLKTQYEQGIKDLQNEDKRERFGNGALRMHVA